MVLNIFAPITETSRGLHAYLQGLRWLRRHPRYLIALFIPMLIGLMTMVVGWGWIAQHHDWLFAQILFTPAADDMLMTLLYYVAKFFLYLSLVIISVLCFVLVANVLASPIYEWVSNAIEQDLNPGTSIESSWKQSLWLIKEELKKAFFIGTVSILLLLIPGLNVLALLVTAFLLGWDFYDFPLSRRGWGFRQRFEFVWGDFWAVLGLGLWMMIPFAQFFFMPMAVAGGTILNIERMKLKGIR